MNLAFLCQAIGIGAITAMAALQGSFWIVVPGTLMLLLIVRPRGLRSGWNKVQKRAIWRITGGNLGVNLGWPFAGQLIGIGAASAIMAVGPVSVGLLDDIRARFWKPIWLRGGVLLGIVFVTEPWNGAQFSIWGVLGAACAAWHFWNIPKCLSAFGDDDAKKDRGMLLSNLLAMPVIALVAIVVSAFAGWSWVAGDVTVGSVAATIGKGFFAALFVMVVPILLINRAAKHMKPSTQGVMFAFSPIVSGIVGFIGAHFGLISGNQAISLVNAVGILMVSGFAYWVIRVREGAKAVAGDGTVRVDDGHEQPQAPLVEPKNPWVRPAGGHVTEPDWVTAQRVPADGELLVTHAGTVKITTENGVGVARFPDGCRLAYRKGDLSVEMGSVDGGTFTPGSFTGAQGHGVSDISVVIGGVPVRFSGPVGVDIDLTAGTVELDQRGTVRLGCVTAAE
ncbi:hypothetical protein GCM10010187_43920 [Actinomadura coerulea]|nr:hypothetical protein [Actinomadura coerulea]GGQ22632.1 hypothetical protein GCM10010187_43920 [Actinomadura coerulea]